MFNEWYETMPDMAKSEALKEFMLLSYKKGASEIFKLIN